MIVLNQAAEMSDQPKLWEKCHSDMPQQSTKPEHTCFIVSFIYIKSEICKMLEALLSGAPDKGHYIPIMFDV
jgi:hypothetical protein